MTAIDVFWYALAAGTGLGLGVGIVSAVIFVVINEYLEYWG